MKHRLVIGMVFLVIVLVGTAAIAQQTRTSGMSASADIQGCAEGDGISGKATLTEMPSSEGVKVVEIHLNVSGMKPGKHAVHLHEVGTCTPCGDAKGHFDPGPNSNSSPDGNHPFHMGDLTNLNVGPDGSGHLMATTTRVTLSPGPLSLFDEDGSAFIIHVDPDTYCPEGVAKGCAGGARAACGIIGK